LATLFLQAITGAHTLTCLLSRNRSRRNRDAPMTSSSGLDAFGKPLGASRANWLVLHLCILRQIGFQQVSGGDRVAG
jgi:hypothetical protein